MKESLASFQHPWIHLEAILAKPQTAQRLGCNLKLRTGLQIPLEFSVKDALKKLEDDPDNKRFLVPIRSVKAKVHSFRYCEVGLFLDVWG